MKKDIYSEKNLMSLLKEFAKYLWRIDLYDDVTIYMMNKSYSFGYKDRENKDTRITHIDNIEHITNKVMIGDVPMYVLDNIKVEDMLDFYNAKSFNVVMDCKLCEYMYYCDFEEAYPVYRRVKKIFEKHGFYIEFGSSWYMYAMPLEGDVD